MGLRIVNFTKGIGETIWYLGLLVGYLAVCTVLFALASAAINLLCLLIFGVPLFGEDPDYMDPWGKFN
jgi:hypothetical protein